VPDRTRAGLTATSPPHWLSSSTPASRLARDGLLLLLAGAAVLAWDAGGLDISVSRAFGNAHGFAWRDATPARWAHDGGRWLGLAMLGLLVFDAWRPLRPGPSRRCRTAWLAVMGASALALPAIKRLSLTSCPWDLAEFGGTASHVPHWLFGVADGGPGHCFPSGHAVSAFALFGLVFLWREHSPRLARGLFFGVVALGIAYGSLQTARGAHFVSHTLWTAWLCAALAVAASAVETLLTAGRRRGPAASMR
jgi:membrane-associated PAP2 superfamily phosphatase